VHPPFDDKAKESPMEDRIKSLISNVKQRASANDEAQVVLQELKLRGVKVVDLIDGPPSSAEVDKEGFSVVLGGIATMTECIEFCIQWEGSAIGLTQAGLIESAKRTVACIDGVSLTSEHQFATLVKEVSKRAKPFVDYIENLPVTHKSNGFQCAPKKIKTTDIKAFPYEVLKNTKTGDVGLSMNANTLCGIPTSIKVLSNDTCDAVFLTKNNKPIGVLKNLSKDVISEGMTKGFVRFYEVAKSGIFVAHVLRFIVPSLSQVSVPGVSNA